MKINRLCRFYRWKRKKLRLKKKLCLFFVLLFASSSIRRLKIYSFLFFQSLSWVYRFFVLNRLLFWTRKSARSFRKIQSFLKNLLSLTMMLRVFTRRVIRTFYLRIKTIVLLKKKRRNLYFERSQWDFVLIQKKTQID
jgi:hypothetical protein